MVKRPATTQKPCDVQWICYFGKSFLMSNVFVFFLFACFFGFFFSSLMSSVSDVYCICYLMMSCEYVILLSLLSLTNAGRIFQVIFKRICDDLFSLILACYCSMQKRQLCFLVCSCILTITFQKWKLETCKDRKILWEI